MAGVCIAIVLGSATAIAQTATGRTTVPLIRTTVPLVRSIVPFDGQSRTVAEKVVTVNLDAQVLFAFDQADLTPQAQSTLTTLAGELKDRLANPTVTIVGHTDAIGTDDYNNDLSLRRATAVRDYLASVVSVPVNLGVDGRGKAEPVAANTNPDGTDNPEGRRRNRRVEITYTAK